MPLQDRARSLHDLPDHLVTGRIAVNAPAIEHFRDVRNCLRLLAGTQDQIVVLGNAQILVEPPDPPQQAGFETDQVDDVGMRTQVLGRKGGAEDEMLNRLAILADQHLVRIQHVWIVLQHGLGHPEQRLFFQHVVVVQQHDEVT